MRLDKCGCRRPDRPHGRGQLGGNKLPEKNFRKIFFKTISGGNLTSAGVAVPVVLTGAANLAVINFQKIFLRKIFLNNFRGKPDKCGCRRPGRPHGRGQLGGNKLPEKFSRKIFFKTISGGNLTSAGVAVPVVLTGAANLAVINFQKNFLGKFFLKQFQGET